jgi:TolA-binding protein
MIRSRLLCIAATSLLFAGLTCLPAHAVNKDMIQLQTQVQQLQDAVARLQQSNDERMGVLKDLVQQTSDAINKMSVSVDGLKLSMQNQQDAVSTKDQQLSGQVQSLNDSLDELKARMARMEKSLGDIQSQQQSTNALLTNLPQTGGGIPAGTPNSNPNGALNNSAQGIPAGATPTNNNFPGNNEPVPAPDAQVSQPAAAAGPSAGDLYRGAYADYISAKYPLASSEFSDLIKAYPDDNLSGNAYFYLGEMDVRSQKPSAAIKNYDQVLERYPDNAKIPAAHLHKAYALIDTHQIEAGERELHALIQRFPNSPEASQARAKLSTLRNRQ